MFANATEFRCDNAIKAEHGGHLHGFSSKRLARMSQLDQVTAPSINPSLANFDEVKCSLVPRTRCIMPVEETSKLWFSLEEA